MFNRSRVQQACHEFQERLFLRSGSCQAAADLEIHGIENAAGAVHKGKRVLASLWRPEKYESALRSDDQLREYIPERPGALPREQAPNKILALRRPYRCNVRKSSLLELW